MKEFSLYHVFGSHMVLQRERPIQFAGRGEAGAEYAVTFAGKTQESVVSPDGTWQMTFPFMNAGGPYELTAGYTHAAPSVKMDDIMIGEVWMCSGQSNMEMPVMSDNPFWRTTNAEWEQQNANYPNIRLFNSIDTRRMAPFEALEDENPSNVGWQPCTPASVRNFSACGYFFGRKLNQDLNIPIGLVNTAWGGTRIEAWISDRKYEEYDWKVAKKTGQEVKVAWADYLKSKESEPLHRWLKAFDELGKPSAFMLGDDADTSSWKAEDAKKISLPFPGRYLVRFTFQLPAELAGKELALHFSYVNDMDKTYVNGTLVGSTGVEQEAYWSFPRNYTIPAGVARAGKNTIVIVADDHYGAGEVNLEGFSVTASGEEPITELDGVKSMCLYEIGGKLGCRPDVDSNNGMDSPTSAQYASTLSNAMLHPWFRVPMRGVIWYQGCTNSGEMTYYPLHQMLIEDLREQWNDPKMPFLLVQLAAFYQHSPQRPGSAEDVDSKLFAEYPPYGVTREIQAEMPEVMENVGMITAFDCGDAYDIHPRDKQTLGKRLAIKAEDMLNWIPQVSDGPTYAGFSREGKKMRVYFDHVGSGLTTTDGKPPRGFVVGTREGRLEPAEAMIDGDTVVVYANGVKDPQRVRYAFTGFCFVNLANREGFPAIPFRTDKPDYSTMF